MARTEYLQIRVTSQQKAELRRHAERAGQDLSGYVLSRALPAAASRFQEIVHAIETDGEPTFALAELHDFLWNLTPAEFPHAMEHVELGSVEPLWRNYVAAMVEQAAAIKGHTPPGWTAAVQPLDRPYFATDLLSLRLHLLQRSPVPFRRRNLFVDSGLGSRV